MKRRLFLGRSIALGAGSLMSNLFPHVQPTIAARKKVLVLGGTNFLGPAIVEHAIDRGHEVTLFNRGITRPHLFPNIEKLRGNRTTEEDDLTALQGRRKWDAVIDVWPEQSDLVEKTARLLSERTDYYFFCSSIAVYSNFSRPGLTETSRTVVRERGSYGGEKALAEKHLETFFPDRSGVARCHSILGPLDDGVTFHYWLRRLADGGEVLAPGTGDDPVQYVDVRDVAAWMVHCVEQSKPGIHNLCGPTKTLTFQEFLKGVRDAIASTAQLVWVDANFLRHDQKVQSFTQMPLWAPLDEDRGFNQIDGSRATTAGAKFRPLADTAKQAWRWYQSYFFKETTFPTRGVGLSRQQELAVLQAWKERQ